MREREKRENEKILNGRGWGETCVKHQGEPHVWTRAEPHIWVGVASKPGERRSGREKIFWGN